MTAPEIRSGRAAPPSARRRLDDLKRSIAIEEVIGETVSLRRRGRHLVGRCPLPGHDDRSPSLIVTPARGASHGLFNCPVCSVGGDVITWLEKVRGMGFAEAVSWLHQRRGQYRAKASSGGTSHSSGSAPEIGPLEHQWLSIVSTHYRQCLDATPPALAYLLERGFRRREVLDRFRVGYSDGALVDILPAATTEEGQAARQILQRLSILTPAGRELFEGCIVIPHFDPRGQVVSFSGRKIGAGFNKGQRHLTLGHRGIVNREAVYASTWIVLTESPLDTLSLAEAEVWNTTCLFGTNGFSDEIERELLANMREVVLWLDNDDAGRIATKRTAARLLAGGVRVRVVQPIPGIKDANELLVKHGRDAVVAAIEHTESAAEADDHPPLESVERSIQIEVESMSHPISIPPKNGVHPPALSVPPSPPARTVAVTPKASWPVAPTRPAAPPPPNPITKPLPALSTASTASPASQANSSAARSPSLRKEQLSEDEINFVGTDRLYRVTGFARATHPMSLRVALRLERPADSHHLKDDHQDTIDLLQHTRRATFARIASERLRLDAAIVTTDLSQIRDSLQELQRERGRALFGEEEKQPIVLSEQRRARALTALRDPNLLEKIDRDIEAIGLQGERDNGRLAVLAVTSRKLPSPLSLIALSSTGAGKTTLSNIAVAFTPGEDLCDWTHVSGHALHYAKKDALKHRVLRIQEWTGADQAQEALKHLVTEKRLDSSVTTKNPATGDFQLKTYTVLGPVALMMTSTQEVPDELANRCLVVNIDETPAQTKRVQDALLARRSLEALLFETNHDEIIERNQDMQRCLEAIPIVIPKDLIARRFPAGLTRTRRDFEKFLNLISSVTHLFQHQRPREVAVDGRGQSRTYISATAADVELAWTLLSPLLRRSLSGLPEHTRTFLERLEVYAREQAAELGADPAQIVFTQQDARRATGLGDTQVKTHLRRLEDGGWVERTFLGRRYAYQLAGAVIDELSRELETDGLPGERLSIGPRAANGRASVGPRSDLGRGSVGPRSDPRPTGVSVDNLDTSNDSSAPALDSSPTEPPNGRPSDELASEDHLGEVSIVAPSAASSPSISTPPLSLETPMTESTAIAPPAPPSQAPPMASFEALPPAPSQSTGESPAPRSIPSVDPNSSTSEPQKMPPATEKARRSRPPSEPKSSGRARRKKKRAKAEHPSRRARTRTR